MGRDGKWVILALEPGSFPSCGFMAYLAVAHFHLCGVDISDRSAHDIVLALGKFRPILSSVHIEPDGPSWVGHRRCIFLQYKAPTAFMSGLY